MYWTSIKIIGHSSKIFKNFGPLSESSSPLLVTQAGCGSDSVAENDVERRLLLAVKSLYSSSDLFVRVGGAKSHAMGVVLQQECVLSPLLFIVYNLFYMNWIDSHSLVDEGVTVGRCRINCSLFCGRFGTAGIF